MKAIDFKNILNAIPGKDKNVPLPGLKLSGVKVKKINSRALSYADRHRGSWFKPEYDLTELQIAQDTDSFLFKSLTIAKISSTS